MKKRHIVHLCHNRELGFYRDSSRHACQMITALTVSSTRNFKREQSVKCYKGNVSYENRRLYFNNYSHVASADSHAELYNLNSCLKQGEKVEDALLFDYSLPDFYHVPRWFVALTNQNRILVLDADNGNMYKEFLLPKNCKFLHLNWNKEAESFCVRGKMGTESVIGLFQIWPLNFLCLFHMKPTIFGTVTNAVVMHDLFVVFHQKPHIVRLHSVDWILNECLEYWIKTDESPCIAVDFNAKFVSEPPVLFELKNCGSSFEIGGFPWHTLFSPSGAKSYKMLSLSEPHRKVNLGKQTLLAGPTDQCPLDCTTSFHSDDSGLLLYCNGTTVNTFKLKSVQNSYHLTPWWYCDIGSKSQHIPTSTCTYTRSGRRVRTIPAESFFEEAIESIQYDACLNMLLVVVKSESETVPQKRSTSSDRCYDFYSDSEGDNYPDFQVKVLLLDNENGQLLKEIVLPEPWDDTAEHRIELDLDLLIHVEKRKNKAHCFIHQLSENFTQCLFSEITPKLPNKRRSGRKRKIRK